MSLRYMTPRRLHMNGQRPQGDPKLEFLVIKHMHSDRIGYHRVVHGHWGMGVGQIIDDATLLHGLPQANWNNETKFNSSRAICCKFLLIVLFTF
jgi:hypothetical protein